MMTLMKVPADSRSRCSVRCAIAAKRVILSQGLCFYLASSLVRSRSQPLELFSSRTQFLPCVFFPSSSVQIVLLKLWNRDRPHSSVFLCLPSHFGALSIRAIAGNCIPWLFFRILCLVVLADLRRPEFTGDIPIPLASFRWVLNQDLFTLSCCVFHPLLFPARSSFRNSSPRWVSRSYGVPGQNMPKLFTLGFFSHWSPAAFLALASTYRIGIRLASTSLSFRRASRIELVALLQKYHLSCIFATDPR